MLWSYLVSVSEEEVVSSVLGVVTTDETGAKGVVHKFFRFSAEVGSLIFEIIYKKTYHV